MGAVEGNPVESSKSLCIFCGLVITVVGIGGGSAAAADGYVAGVAVVLPPVLPAKPESSILKAPVSS